MTQLVLRQREKCSFNDSGYDTLGKTGHNEHTYGDLAHAIGKSKFWELVMPCISYNKCWIICQLNQVAKFQRLILFVKCQDNASF